MSRIYPGELWSLAFVIDFLKQALPSINITDGDQFLSGGNWKLILSCVIVLVSKFLETKDI